MLLLDLFHIGEGVPTDVVGRAPGVCLHYGEFSKARGRSREHEHGRPYGPTARAFSERQTVTLIQARCTGLAL